MEGNVKLLLLLYEQIITFGWMFFIRVLERFTMSCKHPKERYGTFLVSNIFVSKKKTIQTVQMGQIQKNSSDNVSSKLVVYVGWVF
jgi:hypothetical protein